MNKVLRNKVYEATAHIPDLSKQEKIAVGCLLYSYCFNMISTTSNTSNSISSVVSSYSGLITNQFKNLKSSYLSYTLILKEVNEINKDNFSLYTESDVNKIHKLYLDKTKITPFSISNFSQYMYKVKDITHFQHTFLAKIHKEIMIPIAAYYIENYAIPDYYLEIYSALDDDNTIGRRILFNIKGINSSTIRNDIYNRNIPIDYYSVDIDGEYVKLITK